ncbi:Glutaconate CoA-transferase subunit A [compost metagenome]
MIVVAEEIVSTDVIRSDPNRTLIPGLIVSHVVEEPWGCHPSFVQGYYDRDNDFYTLWEDISRDPASYAAWLDEFVYQVPDRAGYMKKLGTDRMAQLAAKSRMSAGVDYGY